MTTMGGDAAASTTSQPEVSQQQAPESRPIDNANVNSDDSLGAPVRSSGFLGAAQPLRSGVLEGSEPVAAPVTAPAAAAVVAAPAAVAASRPAGSGTTYVVQVGAVGDAAKAKTWMNSLSKQFGVPGAVDSHGNVYRVQLGRFTSRQQASALQQRLSSEAKLTSFITVAP
jgi:rare lipoprotein A